MQWNEKKDLILMREMASLGVFQHKPESTERGQVWQHIATNLNGYPNFPVTLRAVRECLTIIMRKYKAKEVQKRSSRY